MSYCQKGAEQVYSKHLRWAVIGWKICEVINFNLWACDCATEIKLEVLCYGGKKLIECDRRMAPQVISDIYSAHKDRFSR